MTEKQKVYAEIVKQAIYICRSDLAFLQWRSWRMFPWTRQRQISATFEVIQFIHGIAVNTETPEFTDADVWFVNVHARALFTTRNRALTFAQERFSPMVRAFISLMPEDHKEKLTWLGP